MSQIITLYSEVQTPFEIDLDALRAFAQGPRTNVDSVWIFLRLVTWDPSTDLWDLTEKGLALLN